MDFEARRELRLRAGWEEAENPNPRGAEGSEYGEVERFEDIGDNKIRGSRCSSDFIGVDGWRAGEEADSRVLGSTVRERKTGIEQIQRSSASTGEKERASERAKWLPREGDLRQEEKVVLVEGEASSDSVATSGWTPAQNTRFVTVYPGH